MLAFPLAPPVAAQILARLVLRRLGSEKSGNYGHAGRPGEVGGSGPGGGEAASTPELAAKSEEGIQKVGALLAQAVAEADYGEDDSPQSWDSLPQSVKDHAYDIWVGEAQENTNVDATDLNIEFLNRLRENNEDVIKATEKETLNVLSTAFPEKDATLPLGEDKFSLYRQLDPETLTYDDDTGDGAPLVDTDKLAFTNGQLLNEAEREVVIENWNQAYADKLGDAHEKDLESDEYYERYDELVDREINDRWNNQISESTKFDIAVRNDLVTPPEPKAGGLPDHWVTGMKTGEWGAPDDENYQRTHAIANKLVELRTNQLFAERGITKDPESLISITWDHWKESSSSDLALALQYATARELGGVHRLTNDETNRAIEAAKSYAGSVDGMQAYARAQWETAQFLMAKSDQQYADVYRGLILPKDTVESAAYESVANPNPGVGVDYRKLPDITLQRAGAQSTTAIPQVANHWAGIGSKIPYPGERVVLRIHAPRTSVLSLPVFGKNIQSEQEVVLAGTKDRWTWDAWVNRAPEFSEVPVVTPRLKAAAQGKKGRKLRIDLQEIDRGQPNWLKGALSPEVRRWRERQGKRTRHLGSSKSGNYGHAGRPGEVGGSAAHSSILDAVRQADGGFTYQPVSHEQPKTGFAVSVFKGREKVLDIEKLDVCELARYVKANQDILRKSSNFLGAWHNPKDQKVYLDVSTVVKDAHEAERLGREAHQLAYFDLAKGESVEIHAQETRAASRGAGYRPAVTRRAYYLGQGRHWQRPHAGGYSEGKGDTRGLAYEEEKHPRDERGRWTEGVPKEPGTTPVAPGMVRGYHYTDNLDSVLEHGLDVSHAKGSTYGEPNGIWMSTVKPGDFKNYVEVHVSPKEIGLNGPDLYPTGAHGKKTPDDLQKELDEFNAGNHDFILNIPRVAPDRFVTHHEPWHDRYRYIKKDENLQKEVVNGEHDLLLDNPEYGPAIRRVKEEAKRTLGGPGSGNFGHAGRPGEVGGSAHEGSWSPSEFVSEETKKKLADAGKASAAAQVNYEKVVNGLRDKFYTPDKTVADIEREVYSSPEELEARAKMEWAKEVFNDVLDLRRQENARGRGFHVKEVAERVAKELGVPPQLMHVVDIDPPSFTVGAMQFQEAGHYSPLTNQVEMNARQVNSEIQAQALAAHEATHAIWQRLLDEQRDEHSRMSEMMDSPDKQAFFLQERGKSIWRNSGYVTDATAQKALLEKFPASAMFYRHMGDELLTLDSESQGSHYIEKSKALEKDDGVTAYSKAYWDADPMHKSGGYQHAVDETLAEMSSIKFGQAALGTKGRSKLWNDFHTDLMDTYKKIRAAKG